MSKYKTILFDMDGTLCDSDKMIFASMNFLYDKYNNGKRRPESEMIYFSGPPIKETLAKEFPTLDIEMIFNEFITVSRSFYDTCIFPYPNSREVLLSLKRDGFNLGVVTNKTHELTLVALKIINLDDIFDVVVGSNDVKNCKPAKDGIEKAISLLNGKKESSLYVGDNALDLKSADNAEIDCCLVNWGPRVLSEDLKPAFKINSYLDLKEKLYE